MFRVYEHRTPAAIAWVFRSHRERSSFWPSVSELNTLFGEYYNLQQQDETQRYMRGLRETRDQLKAEGLPYGEAQVAYIRKRLLAVVKSMAEVTCPPKRNIEAVRKVKAVLRRRQQAK